MKDNILISDSKIEELNIFMDGLNNTCDKNFNYEENVADLTMVGHFKTFRRYLKYFFVPLKYFISRKKYNIVMGWQQFYALNYCFYCSIFRVKKVNKVIALNFTYRKRKGILGILFYKYIKMCIETGYLDYLHVPSEKYAKVISEEFRFSRNNIIVAPFGIVDIYDKHKDDESPLGIDKPYILSIGRSNRDFDFLVHTWKKENVKDLLVIVSDTYKNVNLPDNIIIKNNVNADNQYPWIINSKCLVIPLEDEKICSGDTVLLTAMSFKKIVIVTIPSALSDMYIIDKYNGINVEKTTVALSRLIKQINDNEYKKIGNQARSSFLNKYTRFKLGENIGTFITENS